MNLSTVAKVIAHYDPEAYRKAVKLCEPCITNPEVIPAIYQRITEQHPDLDRTDQSILFAACVYTAYSPASLVGSGLQRAPNGIRKVMCEVMQWNDAPVCNYYAQIASAYLKNPKYKEKVSAVLLGFDQVSGKSQQTELF